MDAIRAYCWAVDWHLDLIEFAKARDEFAYQAVQDHVRDPKTRYPAKRSWTRQDLNYRLEEEAAFASKAPQLGLAIQASYRRCGKRIERVIRGLQLPQNSIDQFQMAVLREATAAGTHDSVAPIVIAASDAHRALLTAYDDEYCHAWERSDRDKLEAAQSEAIKRLKAYSQISVPRGQCRKPSLPISVATHGGTGVTSDVAYFHRWAVDVASIHQAILGFASISRTENRNHPALLAAAHRIATKINDLVALDFPEVRDRAIDQIRKATPESPGALLASDLWRHCIAAVRPAFDRPFTEFPEAGNWCLNDMLAEYRPAVTKVTRAWPAIDYLALRAQLKEELAAAEGNGHSLKAAKRKGRPSEADRNRTWLEEWESGAFKSYVAMAGSKGITESGLRAALQSAKTDRTKNEPDSKSRNAKMTRKKRK